MRFSIHIPNEANQLIHALQNSGHSAYVVGGCVRDSVLGRQPRDWDICTSATPQEVLNIFHDKRVIETGLQHGTITVVSENIPYEITTYRIDGKYSDNRRPDCVTFSDSLIEDLKRRDFTINAMAYNDAEGLIDPFDGLADIKLKKIRCVGLANERFAEDALRILRAIRFSSQLNFEIDLDTQEEIHRQCKRLENISIERINSEFSKMVLSNDFSTQLALYKDVFSLFIPELEDIVNFPQNNPWHIYDVFYHTIHAIDNCRSADLALKLAIFFHDFGKPHSFQDSENGIRHFKGHAKISADITDSILRRLRFDNETRVNAVELVNYHDAVLEVNKKCVKRWLNKIGETQFRRLLCLKQADNKAQNLERSSNVIKGLKEIELIINEVLSEKECFSIKDLAIDGKDLISIGFHQGKSIGNTLKILLNGVINEDIENKKEALLKEAAEYLRSS